MLPTRQEAEQLLVDAEKCNPGVWKEHSEFTASCAEKIAAACGMDADKAYICGLLHDIGRKFGVKQMGHIYNGWKYMQKLGYDEVARICLSHSFSIQNINDYIGKHDVTEAEREELREALEEMEYDEYDLLIQLCDSMAAAEGILKMEDRMNDVKRRYGSYPQEKWNRNMELKDIFAEMAGRDIYGIVGVES